jgi:hypothetical protein
MTRYRAAGYYLLGSLIVATAVFLPIYFLWYPWALFEKAGGRELFQLIVAVDLVVGPLLVFIVFVPGKKGLAFDLVSIAVLQSAALAYGIFVLFESRPVYIVFVKDRFELVRANDIPEQELEKPESGTYASLPRLGPRIIGARIPTDPDEQFRMMMSALDGLDIQSFPKYYIPYGDVRAQVMARAEPLSRLRELNGQRIAEIDRLVAKLGRAEGGLRFLPMRAGPRVDVTVIVDAASGDLLDIAALRPWEYK